MSQSLKRQFVEDMEGDWDVDPAGVLICPHGHRIEDDGQCPDGCESPMLTAGVI